MRVGDSLFHPPTGIVRREGRRVTLSPRERALLLALVRREERPVRREVLLREVWGAGRVRSPRVVDSYVVLLRRKLARLGRGGPGVETVGGVGYRLVTRSEGGERPAAT